MKLYAVYDAFDRQLSATMRYRKAHETARHLNKISRYGGLQATVATPPFRVKEIQNANLY